jgi:predicted XRE-type DNA-binding protein
MVRNNVEVDVKVKCIEAGLTQAQVAEKVGTSSPYVNRIIKKQDGRRIKCGCLGTRCCGKT